MATTDFTDNTGSIDSSWLNDVDDVVYGNTANFKGALADMSVNQTVSTATTTLGDFNNLNYDTDGIIDNTGAGTKLIVPEGVTKVRVSAFVRFSADATATGVRSVSLYIDGAKIDTGGAVVRDADTAIVSIFCPSPIMTVSSGQEFEAKLYQTSGGDLTIYGSTSSPRSWFQMEILA